MYATIRTYTGTPELADQLAARSGDIEEIISSIPGFRGYFLVRTEGGCTTITICDDAAGTEESARRASEYLRDNASEITSSPPVITGGDVLVQLGAMTRV